MSQICAYARDRVNMDSQGYIFNMDSQGYIFNMDSQGYIFNMDSQGYIFNMDSQGYIFNIPFIFWSFMWTSIKSFNYIVRGRERPTTFHSV